MSVASAGAAFVFDSTTAGASSVTEAGSSATLCSTEAPPCRAGKEIRNATTIKTEAATIVIFERIEVVPRGPKAALETLLVNSAPASVLPGWSNTVPTRVMQAVKNIA